ncbi:MAG: amidohydrolase [Chloroflexi bacterium]|nr:amidohydrolase [Chloroflexota bacterium]
MGRYGYRVIDSDAHIFESMEMYRQMADRFMDPANSAKLHKLCDEYLEQNPDYDSARQVHLWPLASKIPVIKRDRPLGIHDGSRPVTFDLGGRHWDTKGAHAPLDPEARLADMDTEGVDVAVIFPSGIAAWIAIEDVALENAVYTAYNQWMGQFCSVASVRFKHVAAVSMRDIAAGAQEIRRAAADPNMVGIYVQTHTDERLLEHPDFDPLWAAAEETGIPIDIHQASSALPPYGMGIEEARGNRFLQHTAGNPVEMMRAISCTIGSGIFHRFPKLQVAYLEAGCGWLPYWLERLDDHLELMPESVPLLKEKPTDMFKRNCYISFDPDEWTLPYVAQYLGADRIVYASDYPHYDGKFPDSVKIVAERKDLTDEVKAKILGENALTLYPRIK